MVDNNSFGDSDNPWDKDPSKQAESASNETESSSAIEPSAFQPEIEMPPPAIGAPTPPPLNEQAPVIGTYYGNSQGYSVSGPRNDGLGIASMIVGIVGLTVTCCWFVAIAGDIVAIVLGIVSLNKISNSNGERSGKGFAIAGIVLGGLGIVGVIVFFFVANMISGSYY